MLSRCAQCGAFYTAAAADTLYRFGVDDCINCGGEIVTATRYPHGDDPFEIPYNTAAARRWLRRHNYLSAAGQ